MIPSVKDEFRFYDLLEILSMKKLPKLGPLEEIAIERKLGTMSKFEKLLVLDPIYFECVRQGDSKRLGDLLGLTKGLQYGINPDESFRIGLHNRPAVNLAIEAGHIEVVDILCNAGCNLMARDLATGLDSLHLAVSYNRTDIVRLLVKKYGANPNIKNSDGMNSLHICARNGNSDIMRALLSGNCNGYSTNIDVETCETKGRTAFHLACIYGHYEIAKMLLEEWGANPMVVDNNSISPLLHLANGEHLSSQFIELIVNGTKQYLSRKLNRKRRYRMSSEKTFASCDSVSCVSELKKVLDRKTASLGLSAISSIIYNDDRNIPDNTAREGIQILVDAGADVDISDSRGFTPLIIAIRTRRYSIALDLIRSGCQISKPDLEGLTPLQHAAQNRDIKGVKLLLDCDLHYKEYRHSNGCDLRYHIPHSMQSFIIKYKRETMYSLKEGARHALRSLGSSIWREIKLSYIDLGVPLTLYNFLDYDDFDNED